jgi:hypothetical protein
MADENGKATQCRFNKVYQAIKTWPIAYEKDDWHIYVNPEAQHE